MPSLTPCLFFDRTALAAAELYASVLPDSRIDGIAYAPADSPFAPTDHEEPTPRS